MLVGRFIAKLVQRLIGALLAKINFDAVMDRAGIGGPLERAGFADSGRFIALLIYYALMLLVLQLALSVFGPNAVQDALSAIVGYVPSLVVAIAIVIITGVVANAVTSMLAPAFENMTVGELVRRGVVAAIWIIGGFAAIDQLQIAEGIVQTLFTAVVGSLSLILIIKFGVGGIWAARDRFWPAVYDRVSGGGEQGGSHGPTGSL